MMHDGKLLLHDGKIILHNGNRAYVLVSIKIT